MTEPDWKALALYLASCHAATLEDLPKRYSKHERKRLVNICRYTSALMRGVAMPPIYAAEPMQSVIDRCEKAARNHAD